MDSAAPDPAPDEGLSFAQVLRAAVERIEAAMRRDNRKTLREAVVVGEMRFTLGGKRVPPAKDADLPEAVAAMSKATKRVYRTLVALRTERGNGVAVWQQDVFEAIKLATPKAPLAIRTVHRAIKDLCVANELRRVDGIGFLVGGEQPSLPF